MIRAAAKYGTYHPADHADDGQKYCRDQVTVFTFDQFPNSLDRALFFYIGSSFG